MNEAEEEKYRDTKHEVETVQAYRKIFMRDGKITRQGQRVLDDLKTFGYIDAFEHKDGNTGDKYDQDNIVRITGRKEMYSWIMRCLNYPKEVMRRNKKFLREYELMKERENV